MDAGRLSPRTFYDYDRVCRMLLDEFGPTHSAAGLRPTDFERLYAKLAKKHGVTTLGGQITMCRSVFKYALESDMIEAPVRFGPRFKAPSKQEKRKAKAKSQHIHGKKLFAADEIRRMIDDASPQLKAMLLLGINGGLGNSDVASLPRSALDLRRGWLDYPRQKTGIGRRIPLWPETVEALQPVLDGQRQPADSADEGLVFITRFGQRWVRYEIEERKAFGKKQIKPKFDDAVAKETGKLLARLELKRHGIGFYTLRHTFETVAGGSRDQVAVDAIMGHVDASMAAEYRHGIEDERLQAVVDHVHQWLFGK